MRSPVSWPDFRNRVWVELRDDWTLNTSVWRRGASVCSLWAILERGNLPQRYYLTSVACAGILRRAAKRGKTLPALSARTQGGVSGPVVDIGGGPNRGPSLTASGRGTERAGDSRGQDSVVPVELSNGDISHCLNAGGMGRIDYETETLVTHSDRHSNGVHSFTGQSKDGATFRYMRRR